MIKIFTLLLTAIICLASFLGPTPAESDPLMEAAFRVLEKKCNVCHRKKNPFMVFKPKNMERRARKIYRAVFIQQRMPKGDAPGLTVEEYRTLKTWLKAENSK